jgi:hypothetical protein
MKYIYIYIYKDVLAKYLSNHTIIVIDIGASGGISPRW